jgi:hypothetical protein
MIEWLKLCNQKSKVSNIQGKLTGALSGPPKWAPWKLETLRRKNKEANFEFQEIVDIVDEFYEKEDYDEEDEDSDDDEDEYL